jgi:hypothetical protein
MDKSVSQFLEKHKLEVREYVKQHNIIAGLQKLFKSAKAAGFKRTEKAVMHALVNIRGAAA